MVSSIADNEFIRYPTFLAIVLIEPYMFCPSTTYINPATIQFHVNFKLLTDI